MSTKKSNRKRNRRETAQYRKLALIRAATTLLNKKVDKVEYPGGRNRESYRLIFDDASTVIATRRDSVDKARRESTILGALSKHTNAVPKLIASNHSQILIQEEKLGERLSRKIAEADNTSYLALMDASLLSLNEIHLAAKKENLADVVNPIGYQEAWLRELFRRPRAIGKYLKVSTPSLDYEALADQLKVTDNAFVKWDARPGNALVTDSGKVVWFDWEHAGKRNRLDDVAWIMADEYVPDTPVEEEALLVKYLPVFAPDMTPEVSRDYLMTYGCFHMLVRLGLILKYKDDDWWDMDMCIDNDKIGVTKECANWVCTRGARWAQQSTLAAPLSSWFDDIRRKINDL